MITRSRLAALRGGWEPLNYTERRAVPERRLCIASDAHVPYHDEDFIAFMLDTCLLYRVEAIVWLGDLMDMPLYSSWGVTDKSTVLSREFGIVGGIVKTSSKYVKRQYWSQGNHEERFFRANKYQLGMEGLADLCQLTDMVMDGSLMMSDNPTLDAFDNTWMLTHPAQYSTNPLVIPSKLATRFQRNVVSAHCHHFAMGFDEQAKYKVVESGGLFNPEYHQYIQHKVTTHRSWKQGFWLVLPDSVVPFTKEDMYK